MVQDLRAMRPIGLNIRDSVFAPRFWILYKEKNMNDIELCKEVCLLARETGQFLVGERIKTDDVVDSQSKGPHDYVTRFDRESERRIVERLRQLLPEGDFIAEENTAQRSAGSRYTWIVDPIDGTTNFMHGLAPTCISIALQDNQLSAEQGRPSMVLGVVYELWGDECFAACCSQQGATLNGKAIGVSRAAKLDDSLIATGFPYSDFGRMEQYMRMLEWTMRHSHGVRRLGSAAADLVYTACGRCDAFYEYGLKPYDVAAGAFIVEKAGGRIGDFGGGGNWLTGAEMVAANPYVFDEMVSQLQYFGL